MDLEILNKKYEALAPAARVKELYRDFPLGSILFTSSFGTTAVYLLHLFSGVNKEQTVYFLDTTYHFPETLEYKKHLTALFGLEVVELKGDEWRNKFTRDDRTWEKDPDLCCSINKVEPLEGLRHAQPDNSKFKVWVSGLMSSQNAYRAGKKIFEEKNGIIKFYPIIDVSEEQAEAYIKENNLPQHPLKAKGYSSVGCVHCTVAGKAREGRWINKSKTECGLHL